MFETSLKEKFQRIFDLKASFDLSHIKFSEGGYSGEQECLFIQIDTAKNVIKDGLQTSKVAGKCIVYSNNEKLPFGYFAKKIQAANTDDTHDLFFYDIETNSNLFKSVVERSFSFVFFFSGQFNPALGSISQINLNVQVNE